MRRPATIAVALLAVAPGRGLWARRARRRRESAAPAATATAAPQVSEAERNAQRDLEAAEGNAAGGTGSTSTSRGDEAAARRTAPTAARRAIVQRPIPFGAKRRDEMRAYARRHYGLDSFRLQGPKVIVEHYTASDTLRLGLRHLRPRRARRRAARAARGVRALRRRQGRDDLPARRAEQHVPPHGRPQRHRDRHRAGRAQRARDPRPPRADRRRRAPDRVAALPLRHRPARRHRPQREPVEPATTTRTSPPCAARPTPTGRARRWRRCAPGSGAIAVPA